MFRNYFLIAIRNLARNKVFSFIHVTGLGIGLACCMLIVLYAKDEWTFDRFQAKSDELFRITCEIREKDGRQLNIGAAAMVQGPGFSRGIPDITGYVRVQDAELLTRNGKDIYKEKIAWADANFFDVFSFPLLSGTASQVLNDIHSAVISEDVAEKYFGDADPVGKTIEFELYNKFESFTITGVAKRAPQNSTISFSIVLPFKYQDLHEHDESWHWLSYPTYVLLNSNADMAAVEKKMNALYQQLNAKEIAEMKAQGQGQFSWHLQRFADMHLDTRMSGTNNLSDPLYSYVLSGIALFILLIACINFINLTVAQSLRRAKEIGIRKVVGGQRRELIIQFLGESFLLCAVAFLLAIGIALVVLPTFNELANKQLSLEYLLDPALVAGYLALFMITSFVAGFYPALVLSGFDPVRTLYNRGTHAGRNYLSRSLVVVQFTLSTFLIIATLFIYAQFDFLTHTRLGYNDKNLVEVTVGGGSGRDRMKLFRDQFSAIPGVELVAPRTDGIWITRSKANEHDIDVWMEHVDENYLPVLQVPVVAGRNFSASFPGDSTRSILVNESYVAAAGWTEPIGQMVQLNNDKQLLEVVGVVRDYHFESLKQKIRPQIFSADPNRRDGQFLVRINPVNTPGTIAAMEKVFKRLVPFHPFTYAFKQDLNYRSYESEQRWKSIISFAAIITVFISCIGLFGLATLSIRKRIKEIGVRKVLGASVLQISTLVSGSFLGLVLIAFCIAVPIAWYFANQWLQSFPYQVQGYWWIFPVACGVTIIVAMLTISFQAINASLSNPVKSLRTE